MFDVVLLFLFGFVLWWIAFGATAFYPTPLDRLSDNAIRIFIVVNTALAFIALAFGVVLAYMIFAIVVGGLWGVIRARKKRLV